MVKSAGVTRSSSSQVTGNDTGTPGRSRGLYAATTVAPPLLFNDSLREHWHARLSGRVDAFWTLPWGSLT